MFQEVVDQLMLTWYALYEKNRVEISEDEEFDKSKERKKMNTYIDAIVILYQNKSGRP